MTTQNLAIAFLRRSARATVERDWAAVADSMAEHFRMEDRRSGLRTILDRAEVIAMTRVMGDLGVDGIDVQDLEVRGDHVALCRVTNDAQDFSVCTLCVAMTGDDGRALALVVFEEDALDAARAELDVLAAEP
jgi:hypothetical protein